MFELSIPAWQIAARTALIYLAVFAGLRAMGKRELGQMNPVDLVVILLIANAVQNAMVGPDVSVAGGILAAAVLLVLNRLLASLGLREPLWGRLVEGTPTILVHDGRVVEANLRREGVDRGELEMAIREHGLETLEAVKLAVLEIDGSVSIVPVGTPVTRARRRVR